MAQAKKRKIKWSRRKPGTIGTPSYPTVDLQKVFESLQTQMRAELGGVRALVTQPTALGDEGESSWLKLFGQFLPKRYQSERAFVMDSTGRCSKQQDIVVFDRQFSPFLTCYHNAQYIPAESVYAVFEVKQDLGASEIEYAGKKAESVRVLHRTSILVSGQPRKKKPFHIVAGLLSLDCTWANPFGLPFVRAIRSLAHLERLDYGCCLNAGAFAVNWKRSPAQCVASKPEHALVRFFFQLISRLQRHGTVPALDLDAYAKALK